MPGSCPVKQLSETYREKKAGGEKKWGVEQYETPVSITKSSGRHTQPAGNPTQEAQHALDQARQAANLEWPIPETAIDTRLRTHRPPEPLAHIVPLCCPRLALIDPEHLENETSWRELPTRHMEGAPVLNQASQTWTSESVCLRCNNKVTDSHPSIRTSGQVPSCPTHGPRHLRTNERGWSAAPATHHTFTIAPLPMLLGPPRISPEGSKCNSRGSIFVNEGIQTGGPCLNLPDATCCGAQQMLSFCTSDYIKQVGQGEHVSPAISDLLVRSSGLQGPAPLQCRNQRDRKGQPVTSTQRLPSKTVQESDFVGSKKSGGKKKKEQ